MIGALGAPATPGQPDHAGCLHTGSELEQAAAQSKVLRMIVSNVGRKVEENAGIFKRINLRLAESVSARNALGCDQDENWRENATMLYGEIHPNGHFRFVDFGHPPPLIFSAEVKELWKYASLALPSLFQLGMTIPGDHPDRKRYLSMAPRAPGIDSSEVSEFQLMNSGDILFMYTDGFYEGSDDRDRLQIER